MRAPKSDKLSEVEQTNVRLRECIHEAERLCESASKLVGEEKAEIQIQAEMPNPQQ